MMWLLTTGTTLSSLPAIARAGICNVDSHGRLLQDNAARSWTWHPRADGV